MIINCLDFASKYLKIFIHSIILKNNPGRFCSKLINETNELPMENNYSHNDILQYIYNELDDESSIIIENALQDDVELREDYEQTIKILGLLDRLSENPSPTTIDLIVEYSTAMSRQKA